MSDVTHTPEAARREMQVHVTYNFAQNRGDHAAEAVRAIAYNPDETVRDLVCRAFEFPLSKWRGADQEAFVILRVVAGTELKEVDDGDTPF